MIVLCELLLVWCVWRRDDRCGVRDRMKRVRVRVGKGRQENRWSERQKKGGVRDRKIGGVRDRKRVG